MFGMIRLLAVTIKRDMALLLNQSKYAFITMNDNL